MTMNDAAPIPNVTIICGTMGILADNLVIMAMVIPIMTAVIIIM